jgi:hypothetical protein
MFGYGMLKDGNEMVEGKRENAVKGTGFYTDSSTPSLFSSHFTAPATWLRDCRSNSERRSAPNTATSKTVEDETLPSADK